MSTRRIARHLLTPLLTATALLAMSGSVFGQTSTWSGAAGNGNWNVAGNWSALPVSSSLQKIVFAGTTQPVTIQNITSGTTPFILNSITQTNNSFTISGAPISFNSGTAGVGIFNNSPSIATATTALKISNDLNINTAMSIKINKNDSLGAEIFLSGKLAGTGNIQTTTGNDPALVTVISSANNTGYSGNVTINAKTGIVLAAPNALFRQTTVLLTSSTDSALYVGSLTAAGGGLGDVGYNQQLGAIGGADPFNAASGTGGQVLIGAGATAVGGATLLAGYNNFDTFLSGAASLTGTNVFSHFGKVGTGTFSLQSDNNAYNAALSVRAGTMIIEETGTLTGSSANQFTVYSGAQFRLNNATAISVNGGRLSDLANIVTAGGVFRLDGSAGADASNTELVNGLKAYAGLSVVSVNANAASTATLTFSAFDTSTITGATTRGGQIGFAGASLGTAPGTGVSNITFTSTTALTSAMIGGILPWALTQTDYVNTPTASDIVFSPNAFVTVNANGIVAAAFDANNVLATTAFVPVSAVNSLVIDAGGSAVFNNVTLTSGAILSRILGGTVSGTGITIPGTAYLTASNSASLIIATTTFSAAGISTTGSVTLPSVNLTGTSPIISVNSGTTTLGGTVTGTTVIYQVTKAGVLNAAGGLAVNGTLRGNGIVNSNVTISSGGLIGASSLAGDNSAGQSPGILTINGGLTLQSGSNFRFYISSVHGDTTGGTGEYTQAKILATTLDVSGATAGSITIQPWGLDLKNSTGNAKIYDFDNTKSYSWILGTFSGGITGTADKFTVNTAFQNFATNNPPGSGVYTVVISGNNLLLNFGAPVPEPTLLGLGVIGLAFAARRRFKA